MKAHLQTNRNRFIYAVVIAIVIPLGLLMRRKPELFPDFIATYAPDALWALLIFVLLGFVFAKKSSKEIAFYALAFSFLIEISQLYQASWIVNLRQTTFGALVLGHGFLWSDLVAYSTGIGIAYFSERLFFK